MERSYRKRVLTLALLVVLVLFLGYIYYQSRDFLLGPQLAITEPHDISSTTEEELIHVVGTADNVSALTLNGAAIHVDQHSTFSEPLLLSPGFNILEVVATDRFGHVHTETRMIVYEPEIEIDIAEVSTSTATTTNQ